MREGGTDGSEKYRGFPSASGYTDGGQTMSATFFEWTVLGMLVMIVLGIGTLSRQLSEILDVLQPPARTMISRASGNSCHKANMKGAGWDVIRARGRCRGRRAGCALRGR